MLPERADVRIKDQKAKIHLKGVKKMEKDKMKDQAMPSDEETSELPDETMGEVVGGLNTSSFRDRKKDGPVVYHVFGEEIPQR